jgi:hypothetical protein
MKKERRREVPSCRVAGEADLILGDAHLVDEVMVPSQRLDELGRVLKLGSELIVKAEDGELDVALEVQALGQVEEEELGLAGGVEAVSAKAISS